MLPKNAKNVTQFLDRSKIIIIFASQTLKLHDMGFYQILLSSNKNPDKQVEVRIRYSITHGDRPRFYPNILVDPDTIVTEANGKPCLYCPRRDKEARKAVRTANDLINRFVSKVDNIVAVTEDKALLSKEWINNCLGLEADCSIDLEKCKLADIETAFAERKRREEEAERVERETILAERRKKPLKELFELYVAHLSPKRQDIFKTLYRSIRRYELFESLTSGIDYRFDASKVTADDIKGFHDYMKNEARYVEQYDAIFGVILDTIKAENPNLHLKPIVKRSENHLSDTMKRLRMFFKWLKEEGKFIGRNPFDDITRNESKQFGKPRYGNPVCLSRAERDKIANCQDLSKRLEIVKDAFVLQCYVGARYGDLSRKSNPLEVINGVIEYVPSKTKEAGEELTICSVPVHPVAAAVIKKYEGCDPFGRLLPFPSLNAMNENLGKVFKAAGVDRVVSVFNPQTNDIMHRPLFEVASTHLARRTFINILRRAGVSIESISSMSGHSKGSTAIQRYYDDGGDEGRKSAIDLL